MKNSETPNQNDIPDELRVDFQQAIKLRGKGRLEEAIELLVPWSERYPWIPGLVGFLGGLRYELDQYPEAAECFQQVLEHKPTSELATRGLFHALWDHGKKREAIEVIRRFRSRTGSDAFSEILEAYDRDVGP